MVIRVLFLFVSLIVLVNLCIITLCYITGQNLYQKYGKQMLIIFGAFVFVCRISLAGIKVLVRKRKDCNGQKVFRYARAGFVPSGMFPCNVQPVCDGRSRRKRY